MSLEAELLELNGAYQNTVATNLDLRERCAELEMLVKDCRDFLADGYGSSEEDWVTHSLEIQQRAKELLD